MLPLTVRASCWFSGTARGHAGSLEDVPLPDRHRPPVRPQNRQPPRTTPRKMGGRNVPRLVPAPSLVRCPGLAHARVPGRAANPEDAKGKQKGVWGVGGGVQESVLFGLECDDCVGKIISWLVLFSVFFLLLSCFPPSSWGGILWATVLFYFYRFAFIF